MYSCEFYKQPVHISQWLYEIIVKTDIQCKKVIKVSTAVEIYGHRQGIHCAMCCTEKRTKFISTKRHYNPRQVIYGFIQKGTEISHCNGHPSQHKALLSFGERLI